VIHHEKNDFFRLVDLANNAKGSAIVEYEEFRVYNRWGELVYDNTNGLDGWDGLIDGERAPAEVYGYYIIPKLIDGSTAEPVQGDITLMR